MVGTARVDIAVQPDGDGSLVSSEEDVMTVPLD